MPGNQIKCNGYTYGDADIFSGNCYIGNSLAGEALSIDTLDASLSLDAAPFMTADGKRFVCADGSALTVKNPASGYKYGDIVRYSFDDGLIGKFYLEKSPIRSGITKYDFQCVSAMGILDKRSHLGGIYVEAPAGNIIAGLMGDMPYTVNTDVSSVLVNGWLPVATCRENLHQVLFAIGAAVTKDTNGDIVIKFISSSTPVLIDSSRIYTGGTIDPLSPCTRVDVTEHAFMSTSTDSVVTLFDTSEVVTNQLVQFDNPCHDLVGTGLTILSSGVNYAYVSGTGTLTGKQYTHTLKVITYDTGVTGAENVVTVKDATLVSAFNSYNVAVRVGQYYSSVANVNCSMIVGNERPSTEVMFTDPFGDTESGYIKSLDITLSKTLKADAEISRGFLPVGHGNNFNNYMILTGTGTWTVPDNVTRIRAILVGGGTGGTGGDKGADSVPGSTTPLLGGVGGDAGGPGAGGLILDINLSVTPGTTFSFACGVGGLGGAQSTAGTEGSVTTFGGYSSASGRRYPGGYSEPKSGLTVGADGAAGIAGGRGNNFGETTGVTITYKGVTYVAGSNGSDYVYDKIYRGGGAGGPAAGVNGGNGTNAHYGYYGPTNGDGGHGADAVDADDASQYGEGGTGGNGGGGGGFAVNYYYPGSPGIGGAGSPGGDGGSGCIFTYF